MRLKSIFIHGSRLNMRSIYSASLLLCSAALGLAASAPAKSQTALPDPSVTAYAQAYDANYITRQGL